MTTFLWILFLLVLIWLFIAHLLQWRLVKTILSIAGVLVLVWLLLVYLSSAWETEQKVLKPSKLAGKWHAVQEDADGAIFDITTVIESDGGISWNGTVAVDGSEMGVDSSGNWKLQDKEFIYAIETSNFNPYFPVGHSETVAVEKVGPEELVYTRADGNRYSEQRLQE